jgi:Ca-activated chloride channel family protein
MWGQIDGVPKLEIARKTLRKVLKGVPDSTELGLIAYGHREKGNCGDIELIVPPKAGTASFIADKVDNLRFLGKTPLSAAVQMAAEELRYTEDKATVILITDGIETCKADVCALGNSLKSQGLDFTAHVVGFGLSKEEGKQVACLAENTGGKYFSANDGESLIEALNKTVVALNPETSFVAIDQDGNVIGSTLLDWVIKDDQGAIVYENKTMGGTSNIFEAGNFTVLVSGVDISGEAEFIIKKDELARTIEVPVEIVQLEATLEAPASVAAGAEFEVSFSGPNGKGDYITIVEVGAKNGKFLNYAYTRAGSPVKITAPDGLGTYEVRYFYNPSDKTLSTIEIEVTSVSATLEAPESVVAGADFEVNWSGPSSKGDYISIVAAGAEKGKFLDYAYTRAGSPAKITAPDALGEYEVRYVVGQSKRIMASRPISLTPVSATLSIENNPIPGGKIEVNWSGPNNKNDYITIVEVGSPEGKFTSYAYSRNGSPAVFKVPKELGAFEVRYVMGKSKRTLTSIAITLTPASGSVSAPAKVKAGGVVEVTWTGPANKNDFIEIVAAGADVNAQPLSKASVSQGSPLSLFAPGSTGKYEVRYNMRDNKEILASAPLSVE